MMMWRKVLRISLIAVSLTLLSPLRVSGQADRSYTVEEVPNVQRSDSTLLLSDPQGYIDPQEATEINSALRRIRSSRGIEFAVVVIPSTGDQPIEDFSNKLFRLWGLGDRKRNDGLLFVLAVEDRRSRWEVGYGLEGYITDGETGHIWRTEMRSLVADGLYGRAILSGISAIDETLQSQGYVAGKKANPREVDIWGFVRNAYLLLACLGFVYIAIDMRMMALGRLASSADARRILVQAKRKYYGLLWVYCLFALPLGLLLLILRRYFFRRVQKLAEQCPRCGTHHMKLAKQPELNPQQALEERIHSRHYRGYSCTHCHYSEVIGMDQPNSGYTVCPYCQGRTARLVKSMRYRKPDSGKIYRLEQYQCLYCHRDHQEDKYDEEANRESDLTWLATGAILGSLSRGRGGGFGGGGFSGGGFGGGSSGGGGSTGSW